MHTNLLYGGCGSAHICGHYLPPGSAEGATTPVVRQRLSPEAELHRRPGSDPEPRLSGGDRQHPQLAGGRIL